MLRMKTLSKALMAILSLTCIAFAHLGCSHLGLKKQPENRTIDNYSFVAQGEGTARLPFPDPYKVRVSYGGSDANAGPVQFIGWDFNKDGRFDMVERLDEQGNVSQRYYDFNKDSNLDGSGLETVGAE